MGKDEKTLPDTFGEVSNADASLLDYSLFDQSNHNCVSRLALTYLDSIIGSGMLAGSIYQKLYIKSQNDPRLNGIWHLDADEKKRQENTTKFNLSVPLPLYYSATTKTKNSGRAMRKNTILKGALRAFIYNEYVHLSHRASDIPFNLCKGKKCCHLQPASFFSLVIHYHWILQELKPDAATFSIQDFHARVCDEMPAAREDFEDHMEAAHPKRDMSGRKRKMEEALLKREEELCQTIKSTLEPLFPGSLQDAAAAAAAAVAANGDGDTDDDGDIGLTV